MGDALALLLADRSSIFLDALTAALQSLGYGVAGAVTTRAALLAESAALRPAICLTGQELADGAVLADLPALAAAAPSTRVVLVSGSDDPAVMREALDGGVAGFVHASRGLASLADALARVARGELVVEGTFVRPVHEHDGASGLHMQRLATYLTGREQECLRLLTHGLDTAGMSEMLGVSPTTVRTHVQAVLTKLGAHSRLEAASLAIRHGLVPNGVSSGVRSGASNGVSGGGPGGHAR